MDTNINIINIDSYLLIKHMYDALSIGMDINFFIG